MSYNYFYHETISKKNNDIIFCLCHPSFHLCHPSFHLCHPSQLLIIYFLICTNQLLDFLFIYCLFNGYLCNFFEYYSFCATPRKTVPWVAHLENVDIKGFLNLLCHHHDRWHRGGTANKRRHDAVYTPSVPPLPSFKKNFFINIYINMVYI